MLQEIGHKNVITFYTWKIKKKTDNNLTLEHSFMKYIA